MPAFQIIFIFLANLKKSNFLIEAVYDILQLPQESNYLTAEKNTKVKKFEKNIFSIKLEDISFKYNGAKKLCD